MAVAVPLSDSLVTRPHPGPSRAAYRLPTRLDATTATEVREALACAIDAEPSDVLVDASAVEIIDAVGLGLLMVAHRRSRDHGRRLVIVGAPPNVLRLLAVTRLHRVLHLQRYDSRTG